MTTPYAAYTYVHIYANYSTATKSFFFKILLSKRRSKKSKNYYKVSTPLSTQKIQGHLHALCAIEYFSTKQKNTFDVHWCSLSLFSFLELYDRFVKNARSLFPEPVYMFSVWCDEHARCERGVLLVWCACVCLCVYFVWLTNVFSFFFLNKPRTVKPQGHAGGVGIQNGIFVFIILVFIPIRSFFHSFFLQTKMPGLDPGTSGTKRRDQDALTILFQYMFGFCCKHPDVEAKA